MNTISSIYNKLNDIPVDRLAASMLYKTKEWQEIPKIVKRHVIETHLPESIISIDYFKQPKERPRHEMQIPDLRGRYCIFTRNRLTETFIVVGYADEKKEYKNRNPSSVRKPLFWAGGNFQPRMVKKKSITHHYWWCMNIISGEFERFSGTAINRALRD